MFTTKYYIGQIIRSEYKVHMRSCLSRNLAMICLTVVDFEFIFLFHVAMSLRRYFKPVLLDPKGSLSFTVSSAAIASANEQVKKAMELAKSQCKRQPYKK